MGINLQKVISDSNHAISREEIRALIEKEAPTVPANEKQMMEDTIYKIAVEKKSPMEAMGVTPAELEYKYQEAYNHFQAGKYDEAIAIFRMLSRMDPHDYRYPFAIGAALQYQKKYSAAAGSYIIASYLDPLNPIPRYHLYDCFMKTNQHMSALWAITEALTLAKMDKKYETMAAKAELEKQHLTQLIDTIFDEQEKAAKEKKGE